MLQTTACKSQGFSLIEVLISVVLLAIGLLANAGFQTLLLKQASYTNARITANDLVSELQSVALVDYENIAAYTVAAGASPDCSNISNASYLVAWQCRVQGVAPTAVPVVTWDSVNKVFVVTITWSFSNETGSPTHTAKLSTVVDNVL